MPIVEHEGDTSINQSYSSIACSIPFEHVCSQTFINVKKYYILTTTTKKQQQQLYHVSWFNFRGTILNPLVKPFI